MSSASGTYFITVGPQFNGEQPEAPRRGCRACVSYRDFSKTPGNSAPKGYFHPDLASAYNCAHVVTGYRPNTSGAGSIVDAAHIHAFKDSRNNDPRNGIALCKNAHWLFDAGLWAIDDDYRIIVAKGHFDESSPDQKPLGSYHGQRIPLPANQEIWPDPGHLAWHRNQRLRMGIR